MLITYGLAALVTVAIFYILKAVLGDLRVRPDIEDQVLDVDQHGEEAYSEDFGTGLRLTVGGQGDEVQENEPAV
ncbi:hypothetical protein [Leptolyngbya sp. FACHB-261]|uniref:hypothetical protein n=1 Tax=Leptolyngbya sp. FACHB-261 TaxID=2692806 RepID=UPI0028C41DC6|nr:hypothetical protein [Leptolyngbya sp. FACHB-261]